MKIKLIPRCFSLAVMLIIQSNMVTAEDLRVAQYNVMFLLPQLVPAFFVQAIGHFPPTIQRASLIGQKMACNDIVSFNEVSNDFMRDVIVLSMEGHAAACGWRDPLIDGGRRYFDVAHGPDISGFVNTFDPFPILDDEIAIVSRFPIIATHFAQFDNCSGIDCWAAKGMLHARIWRGPGHHVRDRVDVFTTHFNNGDIEILAKQVQAFGSFIAAHSDSSTPVIIMGDFNINGNDDRQNTLYQQVINTFKSSLSSHKYFMDVGDLAEPSSTNPDENKRIDYLFLSGIEQFSNPFVEVNYFKHLIETGHDDYDDGRLSDHGAIISEIEWPEPLLPPNPPVELPRKFRVTVSRLQEVTLDAPTKVITTVMVPILGGTMPIIVPSTLGCDGLTDHFGDLSVWVNAVEALMNIEDDNAFEADDGTPPYWRATLDIAPGATEGRVRFRLFDDDVFACGEWDDRQDLNPWVYEDEVSEEEDHLDAFLDVNFANGGVFFDTVKGFKYVGTVGEAIVLQGNEENTARATLIVETIYSDKHDSDGDGLNDADEAYKYHTDPLDDDTDDDGLRDGVEILVQTDPLDPDTDDDGLNDGDELYTYQTDPLDVDTDDDGLTDGEEVNAYGTNPLEPDTDDDGLTDGEEVNTYGTDPLDSDTDDDGLTDGEEVNTYGTDPLDPDTDDDELSDGDEVIIYGTDPLDPDTDDDELYDGLEVKTNMDPRDPDTDDDGIKDGEDVEFIENMINSLSKSSFLSKGVVTAFIKRLEAIENQIKHGHRNRAIHELGLLKMRMDGCGTQEDPNDLITQCETQKTIRDLIDLLMANLQS